MLYMGFHKGGGCLVLFGVNIAVEGDWMEEIGVDFVGSEGVRLRFAGHSTDNMKQPWAAGDLMVLIDTRWRCATN